jgi:uncharacterized protein (TIGR00251 family)
MDSAECRIRETGTGLMVPLHVQPRARQTQIVGIHNGALKVKVSAPPVDDAANRALEEYFSKMVGLPKSHVQIVAGQRSRDKLLHITGMSPQTFRALLR